MRLRSFVPTLVILLAASAAPFASFTRACTSTPAVPPVVATPQPVWVTRVSPTQVWISVQGLTKSASPGLPSNGCACAFVNLPGITSVDAVLVEDADGNLIQPFDTWEWTTATATADAAWAAIPADGSTWTSFKAENCGCLATDSGFGFRFFATVPEGTTDAALKAAVAAAPALLGTDATSTFDTTAVPNGVHQNFWSAGDIQTHLLPHFTTINIFEKDVFGDSGPVDTFALGIGIGKFTFEAIPPGQNLDGMLTEALPVGLAIDPNTGAIAGTAAIPGITHVACVVKDAKGVPWDVLWWKIIVDNGTIPHFKEVHFVSTLESLDTGPVDTGVFDPPGPYSFETVPPGQILGGITTTKVPNGLTIDSDTGAVTGKTAWPGQFHVLCIVTRKGTWEVVAYLWWDFVIDGPHIPATSEWGLLVMTLLALTAGAVVLGHRRQHAM